MSLKSRQDNHEESVNIHGMVWTSEKSSLQMQAAQKHFHWLERESRSGFYQRMIRPSFIMILLSLRASLQRLSWVTVTMAQPLSFWSVRREVTICLRC